jgi:hypothetical protein
MRLRYLVQRKERIIDILVFRIYTPMRSVRHAMNRHFNLIRAFLLRLCPYSCNDVFSGDYRSGDIGACCEKG